MGAVDAKQTAEHELTLEWDSSAANDMIADSTLAVITEIDKSPASVKGMIPCDPTCEYAIHNLTLIPSDGWNAKAPT
jgi:Pre-mRNA 3'-end-processing endonuclease polyadenylation factor C-term